MQYSFMGCLALVRHSVLGCLLHFVFWSCLNTNTICSHANYAHKYNSVWLVFHSCIIQSISLFVKVNHTMWVRLQLIASLLRTPTMNNHTTKVGGLHGATQTIHPQLVCLANGIQDRHGWWSPQNNRGHQNKWHGHYLTQGSTWPSQLKCKFTPNNYWGQFSEQKELPCGVHLDKIISSSAMTNWVDVWLQGTFVSIFAIHYYN